MAANARLTAANAAVLLVLLAAEGVTILRVRALLTPHVFIGVLLTDPQDRDPLGRQQHQQHGRVGRRQAGVGVHALIGPALCPWRWPWLSPAGQQDFVVSLRTHGAEGTRRT